MPTWDHAERERDDVAELEGGPDRYQRDDEATENGLEALGREKNLKFQPGDEARHPKPMTGTWPQAHIDTINDSGQRPTRKPPRKKTGYSLLSSRMGPRPMPNEREPNIRTPVLGIPHGTRPKNANAIGNAKR